MILAITPADAHAITMLAILAFALGSLVTMFLVMVRNGRLNSDDLELPSDEEEGAAETEPTPFNKEPKPKREDWEKDEDWWKK